MVSALLLAIAAFTPARAAAADKSPEDTVRRFLASAKALDLDGMIGCFAVDSYVDGSDFRALALYVKAYTLRSGLPNQYPAYRKANRYVRQAAAADMSAMFLIRISAPRRDWRRAVFIEDAGQVDELLRELSPDRAKKLEVLYVREAVPAKYRAQVRVDFAEQARVRGAATYAERVALIRVEGDVIAVPFRLLKYAAGWQIDDFTSHINNLMGATPMSEKEFLTQFPE